jgi:hypothetical protein
MISSRSFRIGFNRGIPLWFLLGAWTLLALLGCGSESRSPQTTDPPPDFSIPLAEPLARLAPEEGALTAEVSIDGGAPISLAVDAPNKTVTGRIENVPSGRHTFTITFRIDGIVVAIWSSEADVILGETTSLVINPSSFQYPDDDQDGLTNLAELEAGSNPSDPASPARLVSISITSPIATMGVGTTLQLGAIGTFSDGKSEDLTSAVVWSSSREEITTISQSGLAAALAPGTTLVTAADPASNLSGSTELTVLGPEAPPEAPQLTLGFGMKQLQFSWTGVSRADFYRLFENPDGISGFTPVGGEIPAGTTSATRDIPVHRNDWANARYRVAACNEAGCIDSNEVGTLGGVLQAIGYFKASNTEALDGFGWSVAISADGNTLAIGTLKEDSAATGIGGNQSDNSAGDSGAVYLFARSGGVWSRQAYIKASNTGGGDGFGWSVALSGDGNTLAVGAQFEDSAATGVGGDQSDNSAEDSGAVYLFARGGGIWSQQAFIKASNTEVRDGFGGSVALSGDGNTLAVGAPGERIAVWAEDSGAVYLFAHSGGIWSQQAYIKASNTQTRDQRGDRFGTSVALSGDGSVVAVGVPLEDSASTGIGGDPADNSIESVGAVYLFIRSGEIWGQPVYIKASNAGGWFGNSVALSEDGNTLAVGAPGESSAATGIGGNQNADPDSNWAFGSGAVYLY